MGTLYPAFAAAIIRSAYSSGVTVTVMTSVLPRYGLPRPLFFFLAFTGRNRSGILKRPDKIAGEMI